MCESVGAACLLLPVTAVPLGAEDWPQWRGPGRLGVWSETGIINDDGFLIIAQFTPEGSIELDRTRLIAPNGSSGLGAGSQKRFDRPINWSHPAYANRHLVHRNNTEFIRVSLAASDY